jgi:hypothetical protein
LHVYIIDNALVVPFEITAHFGGSIEHLWAKLKKWLRYYSQNCDTIQTAIVACFQL